MQWDKGSRPDMDNKFIEKVLMGDLDKPGAKVHEVGDAKKALAEAAKKLEATYYVPIVAHATMEPMNATAWVQKDRCDVWAPTQGQTGDQVVACKAHRAAARKRSSSTPPSWGAGWADVPGANSLLRP